MEIPEACTADHSTDCLTGRPDIMREVNTENNILEEEYLDCLIKLAFDMDDAEKEQ